MPKTKLCPCGSGRSQKFCCGEDGQSGGLDTSFLVKCGLLTVVLAAITVLAMTMGGESPSPRVTPSTSASKPPTRTTQPVRATVGEDGTLQLGSPTLAPSGGATPQPWEYNAQTNQHWHADHGHWHDGPPPAGLDN